MDYEKKVKYLSQYGKLLIEYNSLKNSYEYLRNKILNPTLPLITDMPKGSNFAPDTLPRNVIRLMKLEEMIQERFSKIIDIRMDIERKISEVEEINHRCVLALRYIEGLKWSIISKKMHYEERWIFNLHEKAIEDIDIKDS